MEEMDMLKKIFEEHESCYCDRAGEMVMTFDDFKLAFAEFASLSLSSTSSNEILPCEYAKNTQGDKVAKSCNECTLCND